MYIACMYFARPSEIRVHDNYNDVTPTAVVVRNEESVTNKTQVMTCMLYNIIMWNGYTEVAWMYTTFTHIMEGGRGSVVCRAFFSNITTKIIVDEIHIKLSVNGYSYHKYHWPRGGVGRRVCLRVSFTTKYIPAWYVILFQTASEWRCRSDVGKGNERCRERGRRRSHNTQNNENVQKTTAVSITAIILLQNIR